MTRSPHLLVVTGNETRYRLFLALVERELGQFWTRTLVYRSVDNPIVSREPHFGTALRRLALRRILACSGVTQCRERLTELAERLQPAIANGQRPCVGTPWSPNIERRRVLG